MQSPTPVRRDGPPAQYTVPPFPSLFWPPQKSTVILYELDEMWKFTLFWTLILYGLFHLGAVGVAVLMHGGKRSSNWKYLWLVPVVYALIAGAEALIAGTLVGLIVGATYLVGGFTMSTWIPFVWGWINLLVLIVSSFRIQGGLYAPDHDLSLYLPHQPKSLAGIATRSFGLGIALTLGLLGTLTTAYYTASPLWRLPFFLAALSLFHFLEFWTTAAYNTPAAEVDSFLLTSNWPHYAIAHTFATLECLLTNLLWPDIRWVPFGLGSYLTLAGLVLVIVGQTVRSVAMIHAGRSFNHHVQYRRQSGHVLVTDGMYSMLRHPSYFGFFWWALGTQVVMGNVVSFVGYAVVLWRFFSARIKSEERALVGFFGEEYEGYRRRVRVGIPFVP
ncbi:hypothetical protein VTI74DRAFT_10324 [Chaetomium olivicolor]